MRRTRDQNDHSIPNLFRQASVIENYRPQSKRYCCNYSINTPHFQYTKNSFPATGSGATLWLPPSPRSVGIATTVTSNPLGAIPIEKPKRTPPIRVVFFLAPPVGLEPTTCGLTVRRSTD